MIQHPNPHIAFCSEIFVCFGSLQFASDTTAEPFIFPIHHHSQVYACLLLVFDDNTCVVTTSQGEKAGVLSKRVFTILSQINVQYSASFEVNIVFEEWQRAWGQVQKDGVHVVSAELNVYGKPSVASRLGGYLLQQGVFLQPPAFDRLSLQYDNPQYLKLPGVSHVKFVVETGKDSALEHEEHDGRYSLLDVDRIFDTLTQPQLHHDQWRDHRIKTIMLDHQKAAHDFIRHQELGNYSSSSTSPPHLYDLWEKDASNTGYSFFRHTITGASSTTPQKVRGGILADDMGLGKSFTMLSIIVRSLADALDFARSGSKKPLPLSANKATLIIVPSVLLIDSWIHEVKTHIHDYYLEIHKFHGRDRAINLPDLLKKDIVLTTYATVATEFSRDRKLLHAVKWYRIILDEAHVIRNISTKQFRAIDALHAEMRWCITGTPIQNSLEDLGALIKFLKVPILSEIPVFRKYIMGPALTKGSNPYANLKKLLDSLCLRRTRTVLNLPASEEVTHNLSFSEDETERYMDFLQDTRIAIDKAVSSGNAKKVHHHVLEALLRLRLFCNHGFIGSTGSETIDGLPSDPEDAFSYLQSKERAVCAYKDCSCDVAAVGGSEDSSLGIITVCQHVICADYCQRYNENIYKSTDMNGIQTCPLCGLQKSGGFIMDRPMANTLLNDLPIQSSTKLRTVVDIIEQDRCRDKSVVFSFWKKTLDRVARLLILKGIPFSRIDGSIPVQQRRLILAKFQAQPDATILLMTLGTGAVGLNNLSVANKVHIIEPQWNPAVESQAVARLLRLGQKHRITIIRYIMNKSVEQSVHSRQIRKLLDANGGFSSSKMEAPGKQVQKIMELLRPEQDI